MEKFTVQFIPYDTSIEVSAGESLIEAAMDAGVHINASCGGGGVCGKCRVVVEKGESVCEQADKLTQEEYDGGWRLACKTEVRDNLTVRIPMESSALKGGELPPVMPRTTARIRKMDFEALKEEGLFIPPMEKVYVELPPPDASDHSADVTRLFQHLKNVKGEEGLDIDFSVIRKMPKVLRDGDFKATVTLERPVKDGNKSRIINIQSGDRTDFNYAIALDIGTTTIYGQLFDLKDASVLGQYGKVNGQVSYGEDVISRIIYAEKEGGLERLRQVVVESINDVVGRLLSRSGVDMEEVSTVAIAGNTTMTQLLLGVDPRNIRRAPYVPAANVYPPLSARSLGIYLAEHTTALIYPLISSYVGGDIVAGVMGSGLYRSEKLTLFIDIGTNAEIVVGNKEWLACTACSAGPAFEGGGIKFGMRAAPGAIEDFSIDPVTWEPMLRTVGGVRPRGICGSGLITAVAVLFENKLVDSRGKFNTDLHTPRLRESEGIVEYVLVWADDTDIGRDITLTEPDIDNLIRAKGAVYSGCETLLNEVGLSIGEIEQIILAGGFGSYIDLDRAFTIGFLPEIATDKVVFIGNGSLMGAKMSALTNTLRQDVVQVVRMMTNFELSETPSYMDHYIAALFLPHTDLNLFPRLKARLSGA
ncbi:ferredoxin [Desulfoluna limicola]|uniref:Ferredoxin n=1 Tax=Desulfoluna limicola TaxID=2810562 RepID=A0ABN6F390_9BACT|nr:ASKHA domain-containing protein [Desulfoluna limicola]BCS96040.1 ferredoxin [Desulfoluna limicola]